MTKDQRIQRAMRKAGYFTLQEMEAETPLFKNFVVKACATEPKDRTESQRLALEWFTNKYGA